MRNRCLLFAAVLLSMPICLAHAQEKENPPRPAPLFEGLGNHHCPITTSSKEAQRYFDQGLILAYGFNHHEAIRSFTAAAKLDPNCAMAYWGIAWAYGPNINLPMQDDAVPKAWEALQQALKLAPKVSQREKAYIQALAKRYSAEPVKDRSEMDKAFAKAMGEVWKEFPDDLDAATIYAEALMDTTPWNYWDADSRPKEVTTEMLRALEFVLSRNPDHPGANHYYIHAVEASDHPERGLPSAHRLGDLCPAAGHLVHMPAHIYLRVGMYHEASEANIKAVAADESYISQCRAQGFYPTLYYSHNLHFLWYSLCMEGRSKDAIEAGMKTGHVLHDKNQDHMPMLQWLKTTPMLVLVRFGKWDEVLKRPQPDMHDAYEVAIYHYARGVAFTRKHQFDNAQKELLQLAKIAADPEIEKLETPDFPGKSVIGLAKAVLEAELSEAQRTKDEHIGLWEKAVQLQDALPYMEPPFWYYPVRQSLGAALLNAGRVAEAEKVYRADLKKNQNNGWSLFGLLQCLRIQGKDAEAEEVQRRFLNAWRWADVVLTSSRF